MNITLKPEQEQFIATQIKQGIFTDFTQAIDLALSLLEAQIPNYLQTTATNQAQIKVNQSSSLELDQKLPLSMAIPDLDETVAKLPDGDFAEYLTNLEDYEESLARGEIKWSR